MPLGIVRSKLVLQILDELEHIFIIWCYLDVGEDSAFPSSTGFMAHKADALPGCGIMMFVNKPEFRNMYGGITNYECDHKGIISYCSTGIFVHLLSGDACDNLREDVQRVRHDDRGAQPEECEGSVQKPGRLQWPALRADSAGCIRICQQSSRCHSDGVHRGGCSLRKPDQQSEDYPDAGRTGHPDADLLHLLSGTVYRFFNPPWGLHPVWNNSKKYQHRKTEKNKDNKEIKKNKVAAAQIA